MSIDPNIDPGVVSTARYTLRGVGEYAEVPLVLPLAGERASGGRITVTLPGPPGGGFVEQVDLLGADGVSLFRICPRAWVGDGGTLSAEVSLTAGL